jgi:cysteine synthase A
MLKKTQELVDQHGWFWTRQFENEANPDFHSRTTAPEIISAFDGERLDYWVTGYGTGGTLKGVARVLRKERPETKLSCASPPTRHCSAAASTRSAIPTARRQRPILPSSRTPCRGGRPTSSRS